MRTQALTNVNQALTSEISARQLAQGAVKQAEARLQLVLDATPELLDTVVLTDTSIILINVG